MKIAVFVSGGRSSGMMAHHMMNSDKYKNDELLFVFCNTGMERPETIEFLHNMVKHWNLPLVLIEGKYTMIEGMGPKHTIVDFDTIDMNGNVFKNAILEKNKKRNVGLPNMAIPYCSRIMKSDVGKSFCDEVFGTKKYLKAIGFRFEDMPKRITFAELKEDKKMIAPLLTDFDQPINLKQLQYFWDKQPFQLKINSDLSNCELCWKKSHKKIIQNIQHGTRFIPWMREMEQRFDHTMFRSGLVIDDFVRMSKNKQMDIFDENKDSDDDSCVCSF
jgi:hypothetical protein